jgi:hypothetical protein
LDELLIRHTPANSVRPESRLTRVAHWVGIVTSDEALYPGNAAVVVGMVCDFLLFYSAAVCVRGED